MVWSETADLANHKGVKVTIVDSVTTYPPAPTLTGNSSEFLNVTEAAALLRISPVTLCRWRIEGAGPPYRKFGRRVLYARSDLFSWAAAQRRLSTSNSGGHIPGSQF